MLLTSVCSYFGEGFFFGGGGLQTTPIEKEKNTNTVRIGSFYIWQTRDQVSGPDPRSKTENKHVKIQIVSVCLF